MDFIDIETGENVFEEMNEKEKLKNCLICKWSISGDGKYLHEEDTICINNKSEYVTEWVSDDMVCDLWESKDGDQNG